MYLMTQDFVPKYHDVGQFYFHTKVFGVKKKILIELE